VVGASEKVNQLADPAHKIAQSVLQPG